MTNISIETLRYRASQKKLCRQYLEKSGLLEVDVPLLARNACPDPYVEPISFMLDGQRVFLQPSPELFLKRLLSQHPCDMYAFSPCFRHDPVTALHNPEFLMLEFYLVGAGRYQECQQITCNIIQLFVPGRTVKSWDYQQLWMHYVQCWPESREDYFDVFERYNIDFEKHWSLQNYHDFLFSLLIQPFLGQDEITVIQNFPVKQAALAQINTQGLADRFEVFVNGTEVANGYHELIDKHKNAQRFEEWRYQREVEKQLFWADDGKFLESLTTFPACSGVAIGIERLLLLGANLENLSQSMPFSWPDC